MLSHVPRGSKQLLSFGTVPSEPFRPRSGLLQKRSYLVPQSKHADFQ